ncbi:MAG: DUF5343 domain-containing protein [Methylotenera sp.]|nr:DUF5343 domain-containing protein [Methylotenera sp.]
MALEKKNGYPTIPEANWLTLREKFKQKPPSEVNSSYLASALGMSEASAGANVLPALKQFGLLDATGKPSELAYDWRDDNNYKSVCEKIIKGIYPPELLDLFHDASATLADLKSWFMRNAKVGDAAAQKFARTYLMLLRADLTKEVISPNGKNKSTATVKVKTVKKIQIVAANNEEKTANGKAVTPSSKENLSSSFNPNLHIDIQIHISPESNADQIDKIFESMAKHLKGFKS